MSVGIMRRDDSLCRSRSLYIVLGGYLRILGAPDGYLFPSVYLFMVDIANPDLFVCGCRTWI